MNPFTRLKNRFYNDVVLEIRDIKAMQQLGPLYDGYLPWSGASLRPTTISCLLNDIMIRKRSMIVEFGSGVSTIFIASLLQRLERDVTFISIDHDAYWHKFMIEELRSRDISDQVEMVHAPLKNTQYAWNGEELWYDTGILEDRLSSSDIDLVIVDGPPAKGKNGHARYPAVPYLQNQFSSDCKVVLDDGHRQGEDDIAESWHELTKLPVRMDRLNGNVFVLESADDSFTL